MNRFGDNLVCTGSNKEIVAAFSDAEVEYLVVGGLAVAWYCPNRTAEDMDLLVNPTRENSRRAAGALCSIGSSVGDMEAFVAPGIQAPLKGRHYADIITPPKNGPSFDEISENAVTAKLFQIPVKIPSRDNLIRLKERAALEEPNEIKHRNDIELLNATSA